MKVIFVQFAKPCAHYLPLCAITNLHGVRKLQSVNKPNKFEQNNLGQPNMARVKGNQHSDVYKLYAKQSL